MGKSARLTATRAAGLFFIALGCAAACGSSDGDDAGGSGSVWAPTTVPFDPTCKGCEELGTVMLSHLGEAKLMVDRNVDDPEAQWTRCVNDILDCVEETKDESACVAKSGCPKACKADYEARLSALGQSDLSARWSALRAVFVSPTSRCAPAGKGPEVVP